MFLRWKKKQSKSREGNTLYAVIYQSYRKNGTSKHKVIKYLASIHENVMNPVRRNQFWHEVNTKLKEVALDEQEHEAIISKLVETVPPLNDEEYLEYEDMIRSLWGSKANERILPKQVVPTFGAMSGHL